MSFKSLIALALAVGASAFAPCAAAATGEPAMRRAAHDADARFDALDRNRDGFLSRDEANGAAELDTRFSELDVNNDGKLSRDEYRVVAAGERETLPGAANAATGATRP